ncbi:ATP-binding protein [uncultured Cohaesibacter sp.]|uniref:ATP-binding protein n=1 Tax=uncultured Cohaesibacter sp. TaxID=1002546 RepID=UPI0029C614ED|nr:ATP-binding protein [uncultured Cohaesibacter sp.]
MEDVVELLAPDAQEKGLSVASWVGQTVPDKLLIDPVRVRQILVNLVGNAIKFTPEGAINLSLDCEAPPAEGEMATILLSVRDTGPGIEESMRARLFEEFEQADTTRTRRHEGTGLGLAISRRLARMMQGDILLSSKPGKGSTFTLKLDAAWLNEGEEAEGSGGQADPDAQSNTGASQKIGAELSGDCLVGIDLTQADRRALHAYCKDWGIEFHTFSLSEWQKQGADLVPDHLLINGADPDKAERIISAFHPLHGGRLTRPVPRSRVILLEPSERRVIPQMREGGINAYLVKPVRQASLHLALLGHPTAGSTQESENHFETELNSDVALETAETAEVISFPSPPHVLLVEDNEINALLARTVLTKAGMKVELAKSGAEALALYDESCAFDVALIDLHMPDMDGMTLFDAMKERDLGLERSIPKIAFTADALQETRQACEQHGFDAYIVKPAEPDHLVSRIRDVLEVTK